MGRKRADFPTARGRAINVAMQHLHIARRFPGFMRVGLRGATEWRGSFQPRETSPVYTVAVRISHGVGAVPQVRVRSPALMRNAPHLYSDGTLCLYWPQEWRWRYDTLLAETILPWTALWLYYYELWLDCGEWLGPSSHDAPKNRENAA